MGTRSLTIVYDQSGDLKVAQYGQFDGYPSGVGVNILTFLHNKDLLEKFKHKLSKVRFLEPDGRDKDFYDEYNRNAPVFMDSEDKRTPYEKNWFNSFIHRNLAEEVLTNIANSDFDEIVLIDSIESGWIEYYYVINFKENKFYVYCDINGLPLILYPLDNLPNESTFEEDLELIEAVLESRDEEDIDD